MIDLGKKPEKTSIETQKPSDSNVYYPSMNIDIGDVDIDDSMIDKDIPIKGIVRITSLRKVKGKYPENSISLEMRKIDFGNAANKKSLQDLIEKGLSDDNDSKDDD